MKSQKPDRFERVVRKEQWGDTWGIEVVSVEDAIKLLRNEHAWMRRMVRSYMRDKNEGQWFAGYESACMQILSELDQRRK